jgi:nitroreductase
MSAVTSNATSSHSTRRQTLLPARRDYGRSLMAALWARRSSREFSPLPLERQVLSDLLWAAYGVNRPETGERTAPFWRHRMVIDIYVAMANEVWLYEPEQHDLALYLDADIRGQTGAQDFVATAPVNLIYVAHGERMSDLLSAERRLYASVDAAFIGQNVYLFCAAEGLATVFRGAVDTEALGKTLKLGYDQFVTFAQSVGYPHL